MSAPAPSHSTRATAAAPRRLWQWLTALQYDQIRDAFLVIAGLLYLLGYGVWSVHAWRNNLGLLPLLDAQYLLAGFIVACILLTGASCAWGAWWVRERIPGTLTRERARRGWRKALRLGWFVVLAASFAGLVLSDADWVKRYYRMPEAVAYTLLAVLLSAAFLTPAFEGTPDKPHEKFYFKLMSLYVVLFIAAFSLLFLGRALDAYTHHWPQELAGPKPRCAYLDLDSGKLSPATLSRLLPASAQPGAADKVVRSDRLNIFFTGETLLAKPVDAAQRANETYEISQSAVAAITWCAP